jgi:hypothetical protein
MIENLHLKLIGTWRLVRYVEQPLDGTAPREPMSAQPEGLLMYAADGYMSVQIAHPQRPHLVSGDWFVASDQEFRHQASSYIAYCGPWQIAEEEDTVRHAIALSFFPNWYGQVQLRKVRLDGDRLILASYQPVRSGGCLIDAQLEWQRVSGPV